MNLGRLAWLVGVALLVMIANVLASILYMVVYSYLIDPGLTRITTMTTYRGPHPIAA